MALRINNIAPLYIPGGLETCTTKDGFLEPTISSIENLLKISGDIVRELLSIGFEKRVSIIGEMGKIWVEEKASGKYEELIMRLSKATGYSRKNVELDLDFVEKVFDPFSIKVMFEKGLIGGYKSIDGPLPIGDDEFIWNKPIGSVFIIAPGNSVIPTLLPTVVSLVSSNFTILRPSITNYEVIRCIFSLLKRLIETGFEDALKLSRALLITYIGHSSSLMEYILAKSSISVVNYWGGEPGRSSIINFVLRNPYKPKVIVNGPLTGLAIIDGKMVNASIARDMAREMIIYDQQLCSSPTFVIFIGSFEEARSFAKMIGEELNKLGGNFPVDFGEDKLYRLLVNRKMLELEGKYVLYSINPNNPWTIAIDVFKGDVNVSKEVDFYSRRRFIEMIVVEDMNKIKLVFNKLLEFLIKMGLDGFQTISTLLRREDMDNVLKMLLDYRIYRFIPLGESLLRTPLEPFDGEFLPRYFTYPLYIRSNRLLNKFKDLM
ncbi:MAG: acyl-CoA reductase [Candidatus Methanomethylicia archaeon]